MNKLFSTLLLCMMCIAANATVYTWNGGADANWSNTTNWTVGGETPSAAPTKTDDVIIPSGCEYYPVLEENEAHCHFIYFDVRLMSNEATKSARIENQHLLDYDQAFCDISITACRYVRMTSPLKNTYTGDFFTEHQTLEKGAFGWTTEGEHEYAAHPFVEAVYSANTQAEVGANWMNRSKFGTYFSFYSSQYQILNAYNGYDFDMPVSEWGEPVNGLATSINEIYPGDTKVSPRSADVWVDNGATTEIDANKKVTFRFPSATDTYKYYDLNGNYSLRKDDNVDHTENGRFVLDTKDGVWRLDQKAASSMFAVGNPAFAYLDIAEFLKKNTDNMLPVVYKHNEALGGRGSESIYLYALDDEALYCINTNYTNPKVPNPNMDSKDEKDVTPDLNARIGKVDAGSRAAYLNPAEGFRVMGGKAGFNTLVPALIGVYQNCTIKVADAVRDQYYTPGTNTQINNPNGVDISMLKNPNVVFDMSINTTGDLSVVRLNNFLNRGSVTARVTKTSETAGTLTISKQAIMAVFQGPTSGAWNCSSTNGYADFWDFNFIANADGNYTASGKTYRVNTGGSTHTTTATEDNIPSGRNVSYRVMDIYGTKSPWNTHASTAAVGYDIAIGQEDEEIRFNTKKIIDGCTAEDIVINYEINDGAVTLTLPSDMKIFLASKAYLENTTKPAFNTVIAGRNNSISVSDFLCEAWFAYEGNSSVAMAYKPAPAQTSGFIFPEGLGTYDTYVRENLGRTKVIDANGNEKSMVAHANYKAEGYGHVITIQQVNNSYNTVGILGLYPEDKKTMVLGQISEEEVEGEYVYSNQTFQTATLNTNTSSFRNKGTQNTGGTFIVNSSDNRVTITLNKAWGGNNSATYTTIYTGGSIEISSVCPITEVTFTGPTSGGLFGLFETRYAGRWAEADGKGTVVNPSISQRTTAKWYRTADYETNYSIKLNYTGTRWGNATQARIEKIEVTYLTGEKITIPVSVGYSMLIPAGQLAHVAGESVNPALDHYFYSHGNAQDMVKMVQMSWAFGTRSDVITANYLTGSIQRQEGSISPTTSNKWTMETGSTKNACNEAMISRQGMQPMEDKVQYDGMILGEYNRESSGKNVFYLFQEKQENIKAPDIIAFDPDAGQSMTLTMNYDNNMFKANIGTKANVAHAPARQVNAPVLITATADGISASSMIRVRDNATNDFDAFEDARLFDVPDNALTLGSLASSHLVGINSIYELDTLPLYLTQSAALCFYNVSSLADEVYLYDALNGTSTLVADSTDYPVVIEEGQQAGRYFLIGIYEAPAIETDVEDVQAEGFSWKPVAYCPASGSLSVACADEAVHFEVYDLNGQLVGTSDGPHTFNNMRTGAYIVNAIRGGEQQGLKVIVY